MAAFLPVAKFLMPGSIGCPTIIHSDGNETPARHTPGADQYRAMKSCASVQKELYIPSPGGTTVWARRRYLDAKGRIEEERSDEYMDDFHMNWRRRLSEDHGHTWSQWLRMPDPKMKDGYT